MRRDMLAGARRRRGGAGRSRTTSRRSSWPSRSKKTGPGAAPASFQNLPKQQKPWPGGRMSSRSKTRDLDLAQRQVLGGVGEDVRCRAAATSTSPARSSRRCRASPTISMKPSWLGGGRDEGAGEAAVRLRLGQVARALGEQVADEEAEDLAARWRRPCGRARPAARAATSRRGAAARRQRLGRGAGADLRVGGGQRRRARRRRTSGRRRAAASIPAIQRDCAVALDEVAGRGRRARRRRRSGAPGRPAAGWRSRRAGRARRRARGRSRRRRLGSCGHPVAQGRGRGRGGRRRRPRGSPARARRAMRSQRSGSAAASCIVSASAAASPGGTCRPSTPSSTSSAMPPMPEQITGRPAARASWMTSGAFSHQVEGTTTQSTARISPITSRAVVGAEMLRQRLGGGELGLEGGAELGLRPAEAAVQRDPQVGARVLRAAPRRRAGPARPCAARCCRRSRSGCAASAAAGARALARSATAFGTSRMRCGRDPPLDEAVAQEGARRDEERRPPASSAEQVRLAQRVARRALLGEAAAAAVRPCRPAAGALVRGQQQALVGADQLVVVQGQHDAGRAAPAGGSPPATSAPMRSSPCRWTTSGRSRSRTPPSAAIQPVPSSRVIEKRS